MTARRGVYSVAVPENGHPHPRRMRLTPPEGAIVLDIAYVLGIIAVFVLVGLVGRGVEKL